MRKEMSPLEIQEITNRTKAMSRDEMELVADNLPVDICINRILKEINRIHELEELVEKLMDRI